MAAPGAGLPAPGPSYLRELELGPGDRRRVGMSQPQVIADGWWVALLWCDEDGRLLEFRDFSPSPEPPPGSPLMRLGPALAGTLSGLILEESGRQGGFPVLDLTPETLRERLRDGKVYLGERAVTAQENFFKESNLTALRELALDGGVALEAVGAHGAASGGRGATAAAGGA